MKKITLLVTTAIISVASLAQNFTATYTFDSVKTTSGVTDPSPLPTATGIVFNAFSATGTPVNPNSSFRFSFIDWATGATTGNNVYASLTGSINTSEYYEVTLAPAVGYTISINSIAFKVQRSGTGVRTYSVRSSADNFVANLAGTINPGNTNLSVQQGETFFWNYDSITSGQAGSTIILPSGFDFTNRVLPITFRFYAWNSEATGGTFSIDDVTFDGSTSVVLGIDQLVKEEMSVSPNPSTNGVFKINLPAISKIMVTIYNCIGKEIMRKEINGSSQLVDLSGEANGSYFIKIQTTTAVITKKIIVAK